MTGFFLCTTTVVSKRSDIKTSKHEIAAKSYFFYPKWTQCWDPPGCTTPSGGANITAIKLGPPRSGSPRSGSPIDSNNTNIEKKLLMQFFRSTITDLKNGKNNLI